MKKVVLASIALSAAVGAQAATSMFGEADARVLGVNTEAGSFMSISGYASEFGFKGTQTLNETEEAFFKMGFQAELTGDYPWAIMNEGEIGFRANYGQVKIFYGDSPLSMLNQHYALIENTPDSIFSILGVNQANNLGVVVGDAAESGIAYQSPVLEGGIQLEFALLPAEQANSETGLSFAGHYKTDALRVSAAFEVNGESVDTSILRLNGDVKTGEMTIGGTFQSASNSALESKATHIAGYLKMPLNFSGQETDIKVLGALNSATDAADNTVQEFYMSFVQNIELSSKVSTYGFVSMYLSNDMATTTTVGGGGLKVRF